MRWSGIVAAALCLVLSNSVLASQRPFVTGSVKSLEQPLEFNPAMPSNGIVWAATVRQPGTRFIRLHFSGISDASTIDYSVVIRDLNNRLLESIPKSKFRTTDTFWTKVFEGGHVRVEVMAEAPPTGLKFSIKELAFQQPKSALFSIIHDKLEDIFALKDDATIPQLYVSGQAVAKLMFITDGSIKSCTGFMIDDERMLTNRHCIASTAVCRTAIAIFGYEVQNDVVNLGEQYNCLELLTENEPLDMALLRFDLKPGSRWGRLELTRRAPSKGDQAYIVQFPGNFAKVVSRLGCEISTVIAVPDTDLGHLCDTADGSSGAPILSDEFKVIGLHHDGFLPGFEKENFGIRMERIMDLLGMQ